MISGHSSALRSLLPLLLVIVILFAGSIPALADDEESPSGLQDDAGVFTDNERAEIEQAIAGVERAGAPAVVYLRLFETSEDRAVRDAQQLMEDQEIESAPGARDGVVMFFNLDPDDPDRGEFGVVAGEVHFDDGALPQSRLNRIRDEMIDYLADDRMAEGIVHGLELTADYLEQGPPEPGAFESFLEMIATGPVSVLNVLTIGIAAIFAIGALRIWRDRPQARNVLQQETITPPGNLHPSIAGALGDGSTKHHHVEAMLIQLAEAGAIQIEPDASNDEQANVRILDRNQVSGPAEEALMESLVDAATDGLLDQDALRSVQSSWTTVQDLIRMHLEELGWFDPNAASRQMPLIIGGILAFVLGLISLLPVFVLDQGWALIGGGTLTIVGVLLFVFGTGFPRTSKEGERQAVPWRGYREGLKSAARNDYGAIDLDEAFPYIVAFGLVTQYKKQLEQASEAGYVPYWMTTRSADEPSFYAGTWFVYWMAFHNSVNYTASSGGAAAGGAAAGSGGAGGRF